MAKEKEIKITLEREYIIPLRKKWLKKPAYKRANYAVKAVKQFIAKHMKVVERDLKKVKIDKWLNHELWFRGIQHPPAKIKVKAKKFDDGNVLVELFEIPEKIKYLIEKEKGREKAAEKIKEEKKKVKEEEKKLEEKAKEEAEGAGEAIVEEKEKEKEEKKEAVAEAGLERAEIQAREVKHEVKMKKMPKHERRMALQK